MSKFRRYPFRTGLRFEYTREAGRPGMYLLNKYEPGRFRACEKYKYANKPHHRSLARSPRFLFRLQALKRNYSANFNAILYTFKKAVYQLLVALLFRPIVESRTRGLVYELAVQLH